MKRYFSLLLLSSMGLCLAVGEPSYNNSFKRTYCLETLPVADRQQLWRVVNSIDEDGAPIQSRTKQFEIRYMKELLSKHNIGVMAGKEPLGSDEDLVEWVKDKFDENPLLAVTENALHALNEQIKSISMISTMNGCPTDYDWYDIQSCLKAYNISASKLLKLCVPEFDAYVTSAQQAINEMSDSDQKMEVPNIGLLNDALKEGSTLVIKTSMLLKRLEKAAE